MFDYQYHFSTSLVDFSFKETFEQWIDYYSKLYGIYRCHVMDCGGSTFGSAVFKEDPSFEASKQMVLSFEHRDNDVCVFSITGNLEDSPYKHPRVVKELFNENLEAEIYLENGDISFVDIDYRHEDFFGREVNHGKGEIQYIYDNHVIFANGNKYSYDSSIKYVSFLPATEYERANSAQNCDQRFRGKSGKIDDYLNDPNFSTKLFGPYEPTEESEPEEILVEEAPEEEGDLLIIEAYDSDYKLIIEAYDPDEEQENEDSESEPSPSTYEELIAQINSPTLRAKVKLMYPYLANANPFLNRIENNASYKFMFADIWEAIEATEQEHGKYGIEFDPYDIVEIYNLFCNHEYCLENAECLRSYLRQRFDEECADCLQISTYGDYCFLI